MCMHQAHDRTHKLGLQGKNMCAGLAVLGGVVGGHLGSEGG